MKKTYIQPNVTVIRLPHQYMLINTSSVQTSGLGPKSGLGYKDDGDDQGNAW